MLSVEAVRDDVVGVELVADRVGVFLGGGGEDGHDVVLGGSLEELFGVRSEENSNALRMGLVG